MSYGISKKKVLRRSTGACYQRTIGGFNIFYDLEDYLVFYTVFATSSRKHDVRVFEQSIMIDHIHNLVEAASLDELSRFVCHYTSVFVKEYNRSIGREGALFEKAFGSAPKQTAKKIRSCIAYIANNPVEKLLCNSVEDYRWNFLAYAECAHPYSKPLIASKASSALRRAVKEVRLSCELNRYLNYAQLSRLFKKLSEEERQQLTDVIISEYCPFDFKRLAGFFDSYASMLVATNANTGSEYEVKEKYYLHSDREYHDIIKYMRELNKNGHVRDVIMLPVDKKVELYRSLRFHTDANPLQIKKFLHLPLDV